MGFDAIRRKRRYYFYRMLNRGGGAAAILPATFPYVEGESFDGYTAIDGAGVPSMERVWSVPGTATGWSFVTGMNGVGQALQIAANNNSVIAERDFAPDRSGSLTRTKGAIGFRYKQSALGTLQYYPLGLKSTSTYTLGFGVNTSGAISVARLTAVNSGTTLATSSTGVIVANTSHWISVQYEISDTVGRVRICVDGVERINVTNVDTANGVSSVNRLFICNKSTDTALTFDDVVQFDDYIEVPRVNGYQLTPSADTGTKQLTPSTGTTNYNLVNSAVVNTSTYVSGSTAGLQDIYDMGNLPITPTGIVGMTMVAYGGKTNANSQEAYLPVNGSDGAAYTLQNPATFFVRVMAGPPSGGDWTKANVDAMQAGFKIGTGTSTSQFMNIHAEVFARP